MERINAAVALEVLRKIKLAASGTQIIGFRFSRDSGICFNMSLNSDICLGDFMPLFVELGYDEYYPIERQFVGSRFKALDVYTNPKIDKYSQDNQYGKARLDMLDRLAKYFEERL